ncbi:MAG: hypothetical protein FJZ63_08140, partial [Chlamydiae bacterium]|nr:hypothetical protein [Chlamydiota bacterium]
MKNFFSFLTFASICSIAYTEIQPAANLEPIYKEVERSSEETLLFLDVGGTLLIHKDPVLHVTHESWKHLWFQKHYPSITLQEKIALVRIVEANETSWALADTWPDLIKKAQA